MRTLIPYVYAQSCLKRAQNPDSDGYGTSLTSAERVERQVSHQTGDLEVIVGIRNFMHSKANSLT